MISKKKQEEKEERRLLYQNDKEAYKKGRKNFVRGVSKTFRTIQENKKEEMSFLEEQTTLAHNFEENGDVE